MKSNYTSIIVKSGRYPLNLLITSWSRKLIVLTQIMYLGVGKNGDNLDIFSCLSVCIIGYGEIGFNLSKIKNWKKSKYSSWIKMYSSKEYQQSS